MKLNLVFTRGLLRVFRLHKEYLSARKLDCFKGENLNRRKLCFQKVFFSDSRRNRGGWTLTSPSLQLYWHQSVFSNISLSSSNDGQVSLHLASVPTLFCHCCCWKNQGDQRKGQHTLKHVFQNLWTILKVLRDTIKLLKWKVLCCVKISSIMDLKIRRSAKHSPWPLSWSITDAATLTVWCVDSIRSPMTVGECWQLYQNNRISAPRPRRAPARPTCPKFKAKV